MSRGLRRNRGAAGPPQAVRSSGNPPPRPVGGPPPADAFERALRIALFCALGLLLLTPFVIFQDTVAPVAVGKALWSRSLIGIVFALWAVLALARPDYRPPRSWILVLLAAGLGVSLLAAAAGASPQRSLWSTYTRMDGVVDRAHWVALAVVLASLLRHGREWRALLGANLAAGTALACLVIARAADVDVPFFARTPESSLAQLGGPLGNSAILSVYMLANLVLASGFATRAWSRPGARGLRSPHGAAWAGVAALHLAGLVLAASAGGFAGLGAAIAFAAAAFAILERGRRRAAALAVLAGLLLAGAGIGLRFFDPGRATVFEEGALLHLPGGTSLDWIGRKHVDYPSVQSRFATWEAGLKGFAERPFLGWGPANFEIVFGRHASGYAATSESHDHAHSTFVETAATTGTAGAALWLALWGLALFVPLRAARAMATHERAFAVFAAAAIAGQLVQLQFLFDTAVGMLLGTMLLAFAARLEAAAIPPFRRPRLPARLAGALARRWRPWMHRWETRATLAGAAVALAVAGLGVNAAILAAADAQYGILRAIPTLAIAEGIGAFTPLANAYRERIFRDIAYNWPRYRGEDPPRAAALLAWAEGEAREAIRTEPWNWRIAGSLARLYHTVAATDPAYEPAAQRHLERARGLAPNRDVFARPVSAPAGLAAEPLADGRLLLRWQSTPGVGFHLIMRRSPEQAAWHRVRYFYDDTRSTYTTVSCSGCRYRIKACRHPEYCSPWARWPAP